MRFLRPQTKYDAAMAQAVIVTERLKVVNTVLAEGHPKSDKPFCKVVRDTAYQALQEHKRNNEGVKTA